MSVAHTRWTQHLEGLTPTPPQGFQFIVLQKIRLRNNAERLFTENS